MRNNPQDDCVVANNKGELLMALDEKRSFILIPKPFKDEFLKNTQLPMSETEKMGFELGFLGGANLISSPLYHLINWLSKDSKEQKRIDSKIRKYVIKTHDEDLLLSLRQLDY
ncbi:hypothetical protein [Edaphobacillus lindanitolerans]|uniref:Uncharacterized protein n=1 Tax=Edaphobacillus lindanitolerans TaxID=550447 RepID=A0A1U7PMQ0_9BACI|nr:hypothetical protein [Edaphobacillus lindanitolerans]SIT91166.1 hypothetical protein SAMN05428946_2612 [Edaphobacillus lindanitolerans]